MNEPRCESWLVADCTAKLQSWINDMSAYLKSLDPKHLVTIGAEGFFYDDPATGRYSGNFSHYNYQSWMSQMGQDFVNNSRVSQVDYMTLHSWPANWDV